MCTVLYCTVRFLLQESAHLPGYPRGPVGSIDIYDFQISVCIFESSRHCDFRVAKSITTKIAYGVGVYRVGINEKRIHTSDDILTKLRNLVYFPVCCQRFNSDHFRPDLNVGNQLLSEIHRI